MLAQLGDSCDRTCDSRFECVLTFVKDAESFCIGFSNFDGLMEASVSFRIQKDDA